MRMDGLTGLGGGDNAVEVAGGVTASGVMVRV